MRVLVVAGARPNFVKVAPLMGALREAPGAVAFLVHTGQHYDFRMSASFFEQLGIGEPDVHLEVGSGSHAVQTAKVMVGVDPVLAEGAWDCCVVVGDVNSTMAAAIAASKRGVPVVHVEAGLRSFDWSMPEEINRVLTDRVADLLLVSEPAAVENLAREGVVAERIVHVGNVMIDTLLAQWPAAQRLQVAARLGFSPKGYGLLTLHRPANVDDPATFRPMLEALAEIAAELPLVFPAHPRTVARLEELGLDLPAMGLTLIEPLAYREFLSLQAEAALVLTDSGGIQEESTVLGVPCLTLRENTERPITCSVGTNRLVGRDPQRIREAFAKVMAGTHRANARVPELWDGHAATRIVAAIQKHLSAR